ncbi:MAG: carboxypeptidase regulatory-like domain-containing protein, partial [Ignavibacteria bacterium]
MTAVAQSSLYKIQGYVTDPSGIGVAGAQVNFNGAVPNAQTNNAGYYSTLAPAGTYQIYVWPPFDSNYINYDEASFTVTSNITKNITLSTGCKVSGYLTNSSGTAMVGASVLFRANDKVYGSGWFTTSQGYYFINVPPGTYTIDAHPQTAYNPSYTGPCTPFPTYYEYNFAVSSNITKNITVDIPASTPTPTSIPTATIAPSSQPTVQPTQKPIPTSTPKPTLPPTCLSISTEASTYQVGTTLNVNGALTDQKGNPLDNKTVILSYSVDDGASYSTIGSDKTNDEGTYSIQWLIQASGSFILKAEWSGDQIFQSSDAATTLSFLPYQDKKVFFVESNSTVTGLTFDSDNNILGFNVTGPSGSKGTTKVTIAKTLTSNAEDFTISLDGHQVIYDINSSSDYWVLTFTYSRSTHQISINTSIH